MLRKIALVSVCSLAVTVALSACSSAKTPDPVPSSTPRSAPAPSGASGGESSASDRVAGPPVDVVAQLIQDALQSDGSVSYTDLVRRLGPPLRVQSEAIANAYQPDQTDTLRTLTYSGVEALVYDVSAESKTFLIRFSLLTDRYATPEGLRVGDAQSRVLRLLGSPTTRNRDDGELIYQESDSTPTAMVIQVRDRRVARIDWEFYFS